MDLAPTAERRIREMQQVSPKRKLEVTVSTENANQSSTGAKRKERPIKKEKESPVLDLPPPELEIKQEVKIGKSLSEPKFMEVEPVTEEPKKEVTLPEIEGAACKEIIEELSKINVTVEEKPEEKVEEKTEEKVEKVEASKVVEPDKPPEKEKKKVIRKVIKRVKVPSEKKVAENDKKDEKKDVKPVAEKKEEKKLEQVKKVEEPKKETPEEEPKIESEVIKKEPEPTEEKNGDIATPPTKPIERRRSKIFETAEKLQNLAKGNDSVPKVVEKPRKITLTGVSVGGFKKEFERKASLTNTTPLLKNTNSVKNINGTVQNGTLTKTENVTPVVTPTVTNGDQVKLDQTVKKEEVEPPKPLSPVKSVSPPKPITPPPPTPVEDEETKKRKEKAVNIISSAISKEGNFNKMI